MKQQFVTPEIIDVNPEELKSVHAVPDENNIAPDIITGTEIESKEEEAADLFIKTVTPFRLIFNQKDGRDIATIVFLCRDDYDKLFILDRNIIIKNEEQKQRLECIPFAEDPEIDFCNQKICSNLLLGYLDNYICDMKFSIDKEDMKSPSPVLRTTLTNVKSKENKVAAINSDTFAALTFIDSYVNEDIINEHDLALATVAGSKDSTDNPSEFFVVDGIDSIVAMAPAEVDIYKSDSLIEKIKRLFVRKEKKHSTSIGLVLKAMRYVGTEREIVQLLTPFDIGVEFGEEKFKDNTIASIEAAYYGDSDQYVATIINNAITIEGVDKTYMMIRGKAKTGKLKLFLLDSSIQKELQDKINAY